MFSVNLSVPLCPICGSVNASVALCAVEGFQIFACSQCQADYVYPSPDASDLKKYYDRAAWFEGGERGGYACYDRQTEWSIDMVKSILEGFAERGGKSILDVGCGYGTHLALAAAQGWTCFGIELSDHARKMAIDRLGRKAMIVESVEDLVPHEFDLILMLDVIEHLPSPYVLLYSLFSIGAITPRTRLIITTPNAGSIEAKSDPVGWAYRHPPSHLTYYSDATLKYLLRKLHFTDVKVSGMHPLSPEAFDTKHGMKNFGGLLADASGSDFTEFMRERYVPGTWSKIAEYEHLPRYELAKSIAAGKKVLDFGCGTGYGSALLAEVADSVTGLDIDSSALDWARSSHRAENVDFVQSQDLGAALPSASFDMIVCFEMIEHVDYATQQAVISSFARLLRDDGVLLISTPNPEITRLYGENPYHIREMSESELCELVGKDFAHVQIYRQKVRASITFDRMEFDQLSIQLLNAGCGEQLPIAFIGLCARQSQPPLSALVFLDEGSNYIREFTIGRNQLYTSRFEAYQAREQLGDAVARYDELVRQSEMQHAEIDLYRQQSETMRAEIEVYRLQAEAMGAKTDAYHQRSEELSAYRAQSESMMAQLQRSEARLVAMAAELESNRVRIEGMEAKMRSPRFLGRQLGTAIFERLIQKSGCR